MRHSAANPFAAKSQLPLNRMPLNRSRDCTGVLYTNTLWELSMNVSIKYDWSHSKLRLPAASLLTKSF